MILPLYVNVEILPNKSPYRTKGGTYVPEQQVIIVCLQGYKMQMGCKIYRAVLLSDGKRVVNYGTKRYGWSERLISWRSKKLVNKLLYLEKFIWMTEPEKLDKLLFRQRNVIVEKNIFTS